MPRWNSCNILHAAADATRLWQFEAKGHYKLNRELRAAGASPVPSHLAGKTWTALWQPKLNVAWLPAESVFLRVMELPKSAYDETVAMVELQLEKLSPLPVTQIVWTIHALPQATGELQTVIVVMAGRAAVEEFLGRLEGKSFLADRLETPMLDELTAISGAEDGAWIYPAATGNPHAALAAWWYGGLLRSVGLVHLPAEGDRPAHLKSQLAQLIWAGELEGWLTAKPAWHLVADEMPAAEWEPLLRKAVDEPVTVSRPLSLAELAGRTARRAAQSPGVSTAALLPPEFSNRYREQFRDRLWLHGLYAAGIAYLIFVAVYFSGAQFRGYQYSKLQQQVAGLADSYTNVMQLQARYSVLRERDNLKFAALDCWKLVADNMPEGLTLERFGFGAGTTLSLYGTTTPDQLQALDNFSTSLQKAKLDDGRQMFSPNGGEPLAYHQNQDKVTWSFDLQLAQGEKPERMR
jgi:hypothetical protein